MVKITSVVRHSRADRAGIKPGDFLVSINSHKISDVLDFRFYLAEKKVEIEISRNDETHVFTINKDTYDDIGLDFETPLMDKKMRCVNKCIFCFIDQLPKGLRKSLYFKDDDSRLSFLHGNYITLTNLDRHDIDRIIEMHISPVNISVHTTDPELRRKMMINPRAGEVLEYLNILHDAGIKMRGQIVLCRGINDGEALLKSMRDLSALYPEMESVSIVPAGLTAYRDGLYPLEPFSPEECRGVIDMVSGFAEECFKKYGTHIFYASDEFYVKSGTELPPYEYWEEFTQIENGVGMLSSFEHEFDLGLLTLTDDDKALKVVESVATGEASYEMINRCCEKLMALCPGIDIRVYKIKNNFFGGEVTVTGLLTATDLEDQLKGKVLGKRLLLARTMLRAEGDLFLDGRTPDMLSEALEVPLVFTEADSGTEFFYDLIEE